MKITAEDIKNLLDSDMDAESKKRKLLGYMVFSAEGFWPAISLRSLGRKRLLALQVLSSSMMKTSGHVESSYGEVLFHTAQSKVRTESADFLKKLEELFNTWENHWYMAKKYTKEGDLKKAVLEIQAAAEISKQQDALYMEMGLLTEDKSDKVE